MYPAFKPMYQPVQLMAAGAGAGALSGISAAIAGPAISAASATPPMSNLFI
jgi:hypothetical protein